jgi:hypothetical protein
MALTQLEIQQCKTALTRFLDRRRPPEHIRDEVDMDYRVTGQSVEIFEIRRDWQDKTRKIEIPIAKTTFVRTKNRWKIFWMRGDLKWHGYEPNPEVHSLEVVLNVIDGDECGCFFG